MTTTFDIDEIERLIAAATGSGVWSKRNVMDKTFRVRTEAGSFVATVTYEHDAALIVTLHNSAPAMIAELRELRAENARLKEGMGTIRALKWDTMKQGCDAASEAAKIARAALGEPQ